ncbi:MAG: hypothetical protein M1388_02475 [Thaumarchaeota archaeon]|jgi:hypothetical protein|nr:hypothetical protein [Nitrososphaerota archaeon]
MSKVRTLEEGQIRDTIILNTGKNNLVTEENLWWLAEYTKEGNKGLCL